MLRMPPCLLRGGVGGVVVGWGFCCGVFFCFVVFFSCALLLVSFRVFCIRLQPRLLALRPGPPYTLVSLSHASDHSTPRSVFDFRCERHYVPVPRRSYLHRCRMEFTSPSRSPLCSPLFFASVLARARFFTLCLVVPPPLYLGNSTAFDVFSSFPIRYSSLFRCCPLRLT